MRFIVLLILQCIFKWEIVTFLTLKVTYCSLTVNMLFLLSLNAPASNLRMQRPSLKSENPLQPNQTFNPNSDQPEINGTNDDVQDFGVTATGH